MAEPQFNQDTTVATIEISSPEQLPRAPLVSVYMLAYRHERYIAQAIEGVIAQACSFPIELIVGEDCSPDHTRDIVLDYQKRYPYLIRVLMGTVNIGGVANGARCLAAARGEFVAFCEGDDYWHHPKKLAMQVQALRDHPTAQLVHTDYNRRIGERVFRNAHAKMKTPYLAQGEAFTDLLHKMTVMTATAMYRKTILDDCMNRNVASAHWPFADYPKALFAAMHGEVVYLPVSTATYRKTDGSATNQGRRSQLAFQRSILECRERFMNFRDLSSGMKREIRSISHDIIRDHALRIGNMDIYKSERAWLLANGAAPKRLTHLASLTLITIPILLKLYRSISRIKWKIILARRYGTSKEVGGI